MKLLNLKLDDLYLRGEYIKARLGNAEVKHNFRVNLGFKDVNAKGLVGNDIFIANSDGRWQGASEQFELLADNYACTVGGALTPSIIYDHSYQFKGTKNILFTGIYTPDCTAIYPDLQLGITNEALPLIDLLGYGLMTNARESGVYPNLVLAIPTSLDYKINNHIFSGKTGIYKKTTKMKTWLAPHDLLNWLLNFKRAG